MHQKWHNQKLEQNLKIKKIAIALTKKFSSFLAQSNIIYCILVAFSYICVLVAFVKMDLPSYTYSENDQTANVEVELTAAVAIARPLTFR